MSHDPLTGRSKGFCFVEYATTEEANLAQSMNGFELAGRKVELYYRYKSFYGMGIILR